MSLEDSSKIGAYFESVGGFSEKSPTADQTRRKVGRVIVKGGAQGLLNAFLLRKLNLPNEVKCEKLDDERSRITMIEQKKHELFALLRQRLPDVFKVINDTAEAA